MSSVDFNRIVLRESFILSFSELSCYQEFDTCDTGMNVEWNQLCQSLQTKNQCSWPHCIQTLPLQTAHWDKLAILSWFETRISPGSQKKQSAHSSTEHMISDNTLHIRYGTIFYQLFFFFLNSMTHF